MRAPETPQSLSQQQATQQQEQVQQQAAQQQGAPQRPRTNALAVLAIIGVWFLGIVGVIFGHLALRRITRSGERGRGIALAAIIIGYLRIALTAAVIVLLVCTGGRLLQSLDGPSASYLGLDAERYDELGWGSDGYDAQGYNRAGYDATGYDRSGYNAKGYDRDGYDRKGFDSKGYDEDGYNAEGFNAEGYDRDGKDSAGNSATAGDTHGAETGEDQTITEFQGYPILRWVWSDGWGESVPILDCSRTFGPGELCFRTGGPGYPAERSVAPFYTDNPHPWPFKEPPP